MIDTIIFDVGRVLVNWDYESYLKRFAFGPEKTKSNHRRNLRKPLLAPVRPRNSHTEENCKRILLPRPGIHRRNQRVFAHCRGNHHPAAVCRKLGTLLKRKGYRLYILSNYSGDLFERTKEKMPFLPYMDGTLFSYTCHLTKPEPEIYQHLIQKFSLTPDRCVFLDDTKANVEAAEQAGIHGIHFTGYEDGVAQLKKLGVL